MGNSLLTNEQIAKDLTITAKKNKKSLSITLESKEQQEGYMDIFIESGLTSVKKEEGNLYKCNFSISEFKNPELELNVLIQTIQLNLLLEYSGERDMDDKRKYKKSLLAS